MQKRCPRCKRIITFMKGIGDITHKCNSGREALDNEDVVDLTKSNWNLQGLGNRAPPQARVEGVNLDELNKRGNRKSTTRTRQHEEYIEIP